MLFKFELNFLSNLLTTEIRDSIAQDVFGFIFSFGLEEIAAIKFLINLHNFLSLRN